MREKSGTSPFVIRVSVGGRSRELRLGRRSQVAAAAAVAVLFVLFTQFIYDFRENWGKARELNSLRQRISEQNLTLYSLHAKFESLETEVERLRMLDSRVKSMVKLDSEGRPQLVRKSAPTGVGGSELQEIATEKRLDRLLDLRLGQLKQDLLVDVKDLETVCERLDSRRVFLESLPSIWPVRGMLTSGFGVRMSPFTDTRVFHHGLDIAASTGTPVRAAAPGKVVRSGYEALLGNFIVLEHESGYRTVYGHLSERTVADAAMVRTGDVIGKVGDTGRTTGPHLHYEVQVNGLPVNPIRFLN